MWGKLVQRPNKIQVLEFVDPVQFHKFLDGDKYDVRYVGVLNDSRVEVYNQHEVEDDPVSPNLNIFVACFTACWTRLRLYEVLELLGERVLYFDTDSVIYVKRPGLPDPFLGDFLGHFINEMDGGNYIVEFVSGGPKNYGYKTRDGKVKCKVQGLCLNSKGKAQLNYEVMRDNALREIRDPQSQLRQTKVMKTNQIVRDAKNYELYTFPNTSVTNSCTTSGPSTPSLSSLTRTDTRKPRTELSSCPAPRTLFCVLKEKTGRPPSRGRLTFPYVKQRLLSLNHVWKIVFLSYQIKGGTRTSSWLVSRPTARVI